MKKVIWQYYFARKFSLQRFEVVMRVFRSEFMQRHFGVRLHHMLVKPEPGGNHAIYLVPGSYEHAARRVFRVFCRNLKTFRTYVRLIKRTQRRWHEEATAASRAVGPKASLADLARRFERYIHWHQEHFNKPIWIIFLVEPVLAAATESTLRFVLRRAGRTEEFERWFEIIFTPEEQNAISASHEALLRLAVEVKHRQINVQRRRAILSRLAKRFGFIPCYDIIDEPWDEHHFAVELQRLLRQSLSSLRHDLQRERQRFRVARRSFREFLEAVPMTKRERELFMMAHETTFLKDERDDYRRRGSFAARPLFAEIGRRFGLTIKEVASMSIDEMRRVLGGGVQPSAGDLRDRVRGYAILFHEGQPWLFSSAQKAQDVLRRELPASVRQRSAEVHGLVGSSGNARGRAAIVHTKHDLRRIKDGDVMVAVTTNPDYVPAMRRCVAIVTDEGGITSHAAIVCRELNIPCIVGTGQGTKVFYDGDLVEVDAVKGVVKKI